MVGAVAGVKHNLASPRRSRSSPPPPARPRGIQAVGRHISPLPGKGVSSARVRSHEMQQVFIRVHLEVKSVFKIDTSAAADTEITATISTGIFLSVL